MNKIKSLLVLWKSKKTTLYYHIGTLTYDGMKYIFQYTHHDDAHRKVREAIRDGYRLHPAFPDLEKEYCSRSLFYAFDRRIPSDSRVDYDAILNELNLPRTADRMDVLRATRGTLSGDVYSFEEPLGLSKDDHLKSHFYITEMRHRKLPEDWPSRIIAGDQLRAIREADNEYDQYAVQITTMDGIQLGYIPGVYAQAVSALLRQNIHVTLTVTETRPAYAPQWWVKVNLFADIKTNNPGGFNDRELAGLILKTA
jgi:hypothetical protein